MALLACWKESHLLVLSSLSKKWIICGDVCLDRGEVSWIRLRWDVGSSQLPGWSCHSLFHPTQALWNYIPAVPCLKILANLTETGLFSESMFSCGEMHFFPAFSEHYQLMKHSGKHEHKAALGQRGDDLPELLWSVEKFLLHILGLTLCLKLSLLHTREVIRLSYVSTYVLSD